MTPAETAPIGGGRRHRISSILTDRLPDEQLTRRIAAGDHTAFDALFGRYAPRLAAYGARLLGDTAKGEDVAQTAMMNAYQALLRGNRPRHVKAWLYRIAQNSALEILSRQKETVAEIEVEVEDEDAFEANATRGQLVTALRALPGRQRRTYLLRELHGLPMSEIAERLGLTVQQVEQALFAARNRLAEELVFGERLTCDTVQALDGASLVHNERRALRGHLRACPSCRASVKMSGGIAGLSPVAVLSWLRGGFSGLMTSGGAPLAAKATAVAVTVALASGVPVAAKTFLRHERTVQASHASVVAPPPVGEQNAILIAQSLKSALVWPRALRSHLVTPAKDTPPPPPGSAGATKTGSSAGNSAQSDPPVAADQPVADVPADPPPEATGPPPDPPPDPPPAEPAPPDPPPAEPAPPDPQLDPPPSDPPPDPAPLTPTP